MSKSKLIQFLIEKPGYLKKGNKVLRQILLKNGYDISDIEDHALNKIKKGIKAINAPVNKITNNRSKPKRLFYDIETSYNIGKFWRTGYNISIGHQDIIHERAIICVSYKWEGEDKVHTLKWDKGCDKELVRKFIKILDSADEIIGHNVDKYDTKFLRGRALYHNIQTLPKYVSYDTLKQARKNFNLNSNKLDYIAKLVGLGGKLKHAGLLMWDAIVLYDVMGIGSKKKRNKALKKMIKYCEKDVVLTEAVYNKIRVHTERSIHHGVLLGKSKLTCPSCGSDDLKLIKTTTTKTGMIRHIMECQDCKERFIMSATNYLKYITQ